MAQSDRTATFGAAKSAEEAAGVIREVLQKLRFGSIAVTIHEGRVVQLDITEKRRLV